VACFNGLNINIELTIRVAMVARLLTSAPVALIVAVINIISLSRIRMRLNSKHMQFDTLIHPALSLVFDLAVLTSRPPNLMEG
jgi:hypothetical protein